jgi:lactoylglutathione lyase
MLLSYNEKVMKIMVKLFFLFFVASLFSNFSNAQQPIMKPVLNHISIYVKDLEASTAFYRDIIGLDTIPEPFHDGKHTWFAIGGNLQLHVISGADSNPERQRTTHTCFSVASVDAFVAILNKHKIVYVNVKGEKSAITIRPDGFKQIYFQDPDGHWIEISDAK